MDINALSYVAFISLLEESNRPPGGKHTIRYWIANAHIDRASEVLEVGSNTGFTSLELARTAKCKVVGIDISPEAVEVSRRVLSQDVRTIRDRVCFRVADVGALPFADDRFSVVVCGGALSFVQERGRALAEILRVLEPWGMLCISPLYYVQPPSERLSGELRRVLGFDVPVLTASDWLEMTSNAGFEPYSRHELRLRGRDDGDVVAFVNALLKKPGLGLEPTQIAEARARALDMYRIFNENHSYLGAFLAVFRKRYLPEERELFGVEDWMTSK